MALVPALDLRPSSQPPELSHAPANLEAEQALLGALLYDNAVYERLNDQLQARHFFEPFHGRLFAALESLIRRGQLAEPILMAEQFQRDPAFEELGGVRYFADLVDRAPPAAHATEYARVIYDLALRRDLIRIGGDIAASAQIGDPELSARDQIESAEQQLYSLAETGGSSTGFKPFTAALSGAVEMAAEAYSRDGGLSGLSTGLADLDQKLGGLHPSDLIILAARPSMGKAQPLDAGVLYADGEFRPMGRIKVGDRLASVDGAPSEVLSVHPQGTKAIYRVAFSDGRSTEVCAEHLWRVFYRTWPEPRVLDTATVATMLERQRYRNRLWIETASGDFGEDADLPLDAWVLGALIGDGKLSDCTPIFTSADREVVEEMHRRVQPDMEVVQAYNDLTFRIRTVGGGNRAGVQGMFPNRITEALKALRLHGCRSQDKFLPPAYLTASRATRLALLRGLLDTDGWVESFGAVRFCSTSPRLARDVITLVRSLGGRATGGTRCPTFTHNGEKREGLLAYVLNIQGLADDELFAIRRKQARVATPKRQRRLTFSSIHLSRQDKAQCITVSHPSRLYVTDDYVVTHNSALAGNIAFNVARRYAWEPQADGTRKTVNGGVVAFFSLEMSAEQLAMRTLAEVSEVPSDRIRKGEITAGEFGRIRDAAAEIQEAPLFIDDTGGISLAKLVARSRRLKRTTGLDLVVVDYLQLVTATDMNRNDNRVQEVSQITSGLKALAKELSVPVLALAQLSRQVENREDKKPQLADLRESGSIEQDADVVMFIYRESYYLSRAEPKEGSQEHLNWQEKMDQIRELSEIIIGKQRHGPIGLVRLHFNDDLTKFSNLAREGRYEPR